MGAIQKPTLLDAAEVFSLNDAALLNNHCIMFLGKQEPLLNRAPSSYAEACEMFVTGLYKVYHELGMKFLLCYCTGIAEITSSDNHLNHVKFILNCRGAFQHSDDDGTRTYAMKTIKSLFRADSTFAFSDWNDFWVNASEPVWKKITEKIVNDSNKLYVELKHISAGEHIYVNIIRNIAAKFQTGTFVYYVRKPKGNQQKSVNIFRDSLDSRFFKIIKWQLLNEQAFSSLEIEAAKIELDALISSNDKRSEDEKKARKKSPDEIRDAVIALIQSMLNETVNAPLTSEQLYNDLKAEVILQIRKQLQANHEATISTILL